MMALRCRTWAAASAAEVSPASALLASDLNISSQRYTSMRRVSSFPGASKCLRARPSAARQSFGDTRNLYGKRICNERSRSPLPAIWLSRAATSANDQPRSTTRCTVSSSIQSAINLALTSLGGLHSENPARLRGPAASARRPTGQLLASRAPVVEDSGPGCVGPTALRRSIGTILAFIYVFGSPLAVRLMDECGVAGATFDVARGSGPARWPVVPIQPAEGTHEGVFQALKVSNLPRGTTRPIIAANQLATRRRDVSPFPHRDLGLPVTICSKIVTIRQGFADLPRRAERK